MEAFDHLLIAFALVCLVIFGLVMSRAVSPDPFLAPLSMGSSR